MLDQIIFQNVSPLCSVGGLQQCAAMMVVAGKKFFLQQLHSCSPHRLLNSSSVRPDQEDHQPQKICNFWKFQKKIRENNNY